MGSGLAAIAMSGFFPASSAFLFYQAPIDVSQLADFGPLRDGSLRVIDLGHLQGLVSMPSYHTVTAILLIHAMRRSGPLFPIFAVVNLIVILSTLSEGGHFLVDVLGGIVLAAATIAATRWYGRRFGAARQPGAPAVPEHTAA